MQRKQQKEILRGLGGCETLMKYEHVWMTAASSPSMQCSFNREISSAELCRDTFYCSNNFFLPSRGLLFLQQVFFLFILHGVHCNSDPCRSKSLHLIFYWISSTNGKGSSCQFPHPPADILSSASSPTPTPYHSLTSRLFVHVAPNNMKYFIATSVFFLRKISAFWYYSQVNFQRDLLFILYHKILGNQDSHFIAILLIFIYYSLSRQLKQQFIKNIKWMCLSAKKTIQKEIVPKLDK